MNKYEYSTVDVVLADPDTGARNSLEMILRNQGFRNIKVGESIADIRRHLKQTPPDLLITGADLSDGSVCPTIHAVRHHEIGNNPFVLVIATTANPSTEQVREIVNSGIDDLLIKPLSTSALLNRVNTLVSERKPFVVTFDYIGPDRRKSIDRETNIPHYDVPNTLAAKATGEGVESIHIFIRKMTLEINEQKLDRHVRQFHWLANALIAEFTSHGASETFAGHLDRLAFVAQDTARRVERTSRDHITKHCKSVLGLNARICKNSKSPNASIVIPRDLAVVTQMAAAIQAGFATDVEATAR